MVSVDDNHELGLVYPVSAATALRTYHGHSGKPGLPTGAGAVSICSKTATIWETKAQPEIGKADSGRVSCSGIEKDDAVEI